MNENVKVQALRRVILEPKKRQPGPQPRRRKESASLGRGCALEMQPVIEAVQEYARHTYGLGALQGAVVIEKMIDRIKGLGDPSGDLQVIIAQGRDAANRLRHQHATVYER